MWDYPVLQVPIVVARIATMMIYYNTGMWDVVIWSVSLLADGFPLGPSLDVEKCGEPAGKFASAVCALYIFETALRILIWMGWRTLVSAVYPRVA